MSLRNTQTEYGSIAKLFHWVLFVLIAGMLTFGFFLDDMPEAYKPMIYNFHKLTGLTILTLMLMRLFWAATNIKPSLPVGTSWMERLAEHGVHTTLYVLLLAMPLAGWIGSTAANHPPHLGALVIAVPFIPESKALSKTAMYMHEQIAIALIVLIVLHIAAALYHHYVKKDNVLRRMMPSR